MNPRHPRFLTLAGLVLAAALARLIPHPPNFTPIAAMALLGGATFRSRWAAFGVPLGAMVVSDVLLGLTRYGLMALASRPAVYAAFALSVCLGMAIRRRRTPMSVGAAALTGSVGFFLITNFSVSLGSALYPPTPGGLLACYAAAIPFFRNTLLGDAFYTGILFVSLALLERLAPVLQEEASR